MDTTLRFKLFGSGKLPDEARSALAADEVLAIAEGSALTSASLAMSQAFTPEEGLSASPERS
jgi:hypothetical protein